MLPVDRAIFIIWMGGVGLGAIIAAYLLTSEKTENWSERKIALVAMGCSSATVALLLAALT